MIELIIKKAKIMAIYPKGMKATVDGVGGFIKRRDIAWEDPYIDIFNLFKVDQEIDVAILGIDPDHDNNLILSIKHVKYDPWVGLHSKFNETQRKNEVLIVKGKVEEVLADRIYILLEDFNKAILFKEDIEDLGDFGKLELAEIFFIGDLVRGVSKKIDEERRIVELSISSYINYLYNKYKLSSEKVTIKDIFGDTLEHFMKTIELQHTSIEDLNNLGILGMDSLHKVFFIEDNPNMAEEIIGTLKKIGINEYFPNSPSFIFSDINRGKYESILSENINEYTCAIIDKHLVNEDSLTYVRKILTLKPDFPIIVVTAEHPLRAIDRLKKETLYDNVYLLIRPYRTDEIIAALEWSKKTSDERLRVIKEHQFQHSFSIENQKLSEKEQIEAIVARFCTSADKKAFILEMNPITMEINLLLSFGMAKDIDWSLHKTTLRHTPFFDVIKNKRPDYFQSIPEARKKHFPDEIKKAQSMMGVPIDVLGDIKYGFFIVSLDESLKLLDYSHLLNEAINLSYILERFLFKKTILDDILFREMGLLYSSMRHEVLSLSEGLKFDLEKEWDKVKPLLSQSGIIAEQARTEFRNSIQAVQDVINKINYLLHFYTLLDKKEESPGWFDITKLIEDIIQTLRSNDDVLGIDVELIKDNKNSSIKIFSHKPRIRQSIMNVILNACQQIKQSKLPVPKVIINIWQENIGTAMPVKIKVTDTGPGIHRKDFERIFNPLYTTRKAGMGLGLNICKEYLERVGGNINILSSFILTGTELLIELPERC